MLAEEHEAQRGEAEVDAAHAAGDRAEQRAGEAGQRDRADQREQRREPQPGRPVRARHVLAGQERVAVGADRDEERVAEGQLAGEADEQRQPDRGDDRRHREQPGLQPEASR